MIHDITHIKPAEEDLKLKSFTLDNLGEEIFWLSDDCRILGLWVASRSGPTAV